MTYGTAQTTKFMLGAATLMIGSQDDLFNMTREGNSIGLVKEVTFTTGPSFINLSQGVKNTNVHSTMNAETVRVTTNVYEHTAKNLAYLSQLNADLMTYNTAYQTAINGAVLSGAPLFAVDDASGLAVDDWIVVYDPAYEDDVYICKIDQILGNNVYPEAPIGRNISDNAVVKLVNVTAISGKEEAPYLSAVISGQLANGEQVNIVMPKIKIVSGVDLYFRTDDYGNIPLNIQVYDLISTDPYYEYFGATPVKIMTRADGPPPPPLLIVGSPTSGNVGSAYSFTPSVSGGEGTKTFALTGGTLQGGLSFNTSTGVISGTPYGYGTVSGLTITVSDVSGSASLGPFSLNVATPVPTNQQLITNFTGVPNAAQVAMGGTFTGNLGRMQHTMGRVGATNIRIRDDAIRITPGSGVETSLPANDTTYERALEKTVGGTTRFLYSGGNSATLSAGNSLTSDALVLRLEAGEQFFSRMYRTVPNPSTDSLSAIDRVAVAQQGFRVSTASQLMNTGAMNASGSGGGPSVFPSLITGVPDAPLAAFVLVTDSIGNGSNDTNTDSTSAFLNRALISVNGYAVPWTRQTVGGNTLNAQQTASTPKQKAIWPFVTDVFIHLGTNDLGALTTGTAADRLAILQARFTNIANTARATIGPYGYRLRVHASSIIRRSSFDSNQETARINYNAWLAAGADGLVDEYYDIVAAANDPSTYSDGIHPNPSDHANMAAVVNPKLVPYLNPFYKLV